jgi:hypothetical protein
MGSASLLQNSTGAYNTALGSGSLYSNTTASYNTAVGYEAGYSNTVTGGLTAVGYTALQTANGVEEATAVGYQALQSATTGNGHTAVGYNALASVTTNAFSTAVGLRSLQSASGTRNTALGAYSGYSTTSGGYNTAIGMEALYSNTTASYNTAVGYEALFSYVSGSGENVAIGAQALRSQTTGYENIAIGRSAGRDVTTGVRNVLVGDDAGYYITTGSKNTIIGRYNGNQGGLDIRTSDNNIVLSDGDGNPRLYVDSSGNVRIGNTGGAWPGSDGIILLEEGILQASLNNSASLYLNRGSSNGNVAQFARSSTTVGGISVTTTSTSFNTSSDHRLKENVVELTSATARLNQLAPKRFNFIADDTTTVDGFIAHEVQSVVPEAITGTHNEVDADGNPVYQGIDQSKLVPLLVATIQELEARITALENA